MYLLKGIVAAELQKCSFCLPLNLSQSRGCGWKLLCQQASDMLKCPGGRNQISGSFIRQKRISPFKLWILNLNVWFLLFFLVSQSPSSFFFSHANLCWTSARMSGMDVPLVDHNETGISPVDNGTFLRFSPTSASTSAAASSPGRPGNVYVYVWLFLGLLVFLLTLLIISLHRLKNIISSSSSVPDCSSEGGSSFTNMEICSISSQRSTISSLSTWGRWEGAPTDTWACVYVQVHFLMHACNSRQACTDTRGPATPHCDKKHVSHKGSMAFHSMHVYSNPTGPVSLLFSCTLQKHRRLRAHDVMKRCWRVRMTEPF